MIHSCSKTTKWYNSQHLQLFSIPLKFQAMSFSSTLSGDNSNRTPNSHLYHELPSASQNVSYEMESMSRPKETV